MPELHNNTVDPLFDHFVSSVVASVVRGESLPQTYALAERMGPACVLPAIDPDADREQQLILFRTLARAIADQTPRPELGYDTRKQARPGRNDRCDCGSGRKYKQCCGPLEHGAPVERMNLLPHVLKQMPRKRWGELADSAIDPQMVAATAFEMLAADDAVAVVALLEPWFKGEAPIPAARELMLDALLDAFGALARPRKKQKLLQAALQRGDRVIRSSTLQRLATLAADEGDFTRAWQYFQAAQREHADSASLSHLEIVLLMSQGEVVRAQQRARFWIARLTRIDAEEHHDLIGFLREVTVHGEQALFEMQGRDWPELETLRSLLAQAPAPAVMQRLQGGDDDSAGYIAPVPELRNALKSWHQRFVRSEPTLTAMGVPDHPAWDDPDPWLDCLREQPLLWQSLDVLDDLVLALTAVPAFGVEQTLAEPLLARAQTLFDQLIETEGVQGKALHWGFRQNRPALRLLAQRIVMDVEQPDDLSVTRIERMLALNPGDNHGFRSVLMTAYLQRRQFEQADQLAMQFGDDTELGFSQVLALWALGRTGDALHGLQQAHARLPRLLPTLLARNPRKPRIEPGFIRYGGADQAWLFRERQRPVWESLPGALEWLRQAKKALK